jgi:hypothetical protein
MAIEWRGPAHAPTANVRWYGPEWIALTVDHPAPTVAPGLPARPDSYAIRPGAGAGERESIWKKTSLPDTGWTLLPSGGHTIHTISGSNTSSVTLTVDGSKRLCLLGRLRNRTESWDDAYATVNATDKADAAYATRGYIDGHLGVPDVANGTEWQWPPYSGLYTGAGPAQNMGYGHVGFTSGLFLGRCAPSVDLGFEARLELRAGRNRVCLSQAISGKAGVFQPSYFFGQSLNSMWADAATAIATVKIWFKFSEGDELEWWQE